MTTGGCSVASAIIARFTPVRVYCALSKHSAFWAVLDSVVLVTAGALGTLRRSHEAAMPGA